MKGYTIMAMSRSHPHKSSWQLNGLRAVLEHREASSDVPEIFDEAEQDLFEVAVIDRCMHHVARHQAIGVAGIF
jgi:hypothetical protein